MIFDNDDDDDDDADDAMIRTFGSYVVGGCIYGSRLYGLW